VLANCPPLPWAAWAPVAGYARRPRSRPHSVRSASWVGSMNTCLVTQITSTRRTRHADDGVSVW